MTNVAVSWRGVSMDAEIDEVELAGAIAAGAAVVRWPLEQQLYDAPRSSRFAGPWHLVSSC